jgi:hypothetical protein
MTDVINPDDGHIVVVRFLFHEKRIQFCDMYNDMRVLKTVEVPHKVLTGKILGPLMVTVGTDPESVHLMNVQDGSTATLDLHAPLGCLCSLDIHRSLTKVAVVTTAGLFVSCSCFNSLLLSNRPHVHLQVR